MGGLLQAIRVRTAFVLLDRIEAAGAILTTEGVKQAAAVTEDDKILIQMLKPELQEIARQESQRRQVAALPPGTIISEKT